MQIMVGDYFIEGEWDGATFKFNVPLDYDPSKVVEVVIPVTHTVMEAVKEFGTPIDPWENMEGIL